VFNMSTSILHNTFKTTTPLIDATFNETLLFFSFSNVFVCDRLIAEDTTNSIIHWITIRDVWWPHLRPDEVDVLFFRVDCIGPCSLVCRPAETSICDGGILLVCQTTGTFPGRLDSSSLVGAVDLCDST